MIEKLIDGLLKAKLHLLFFLVGVALLGASMLRWDRGSIMPVPRDTPGWSAVVIGLLLLGVSIALFLYHPAPAEAVQPAPAPVVVAPPMSPVAIGTDADEIDIHFLQLSATQKTLMFFLYQYLHKSEVAVGDLFKQHGEKYGADLIASESELYYRVKDLAAKKLVGLRSVGEKTTIVVSLPEVGKVLTDRNRITT